MPAYIVNQDTAVGALLFDGTNIKEMLDFIGIKNVAGYDLTTVSKYIKIEGARGYYRTLHQGSYFVRFKDGSVEIISQGTFEKIYSKTNKFNFTDEEYAQFMDDAVRISHSGTSFRLSGDKYTIQFHVPAQIIISTEMTPQAIQEILKEKLDPQGKYIFHFNDKDVHSGYISKGEDYAILNSDL